MTTNASKRTKKRLMILVLIPLLSCGFSSVVSILIGQVGNLFLTVVGETAERMTIPFFIGLFVVSFGLSFLFSSLLKKWLLRPHKAAG